MAEIKPHKNKNQDNKEEKISEDIKPIKYQDLPRNEDVKVGIGSNFFTKKKPKFLFSKVSAGIFVFAFALIGVYLLVGSHASAPFAGSITDYTDSHYLTGLPFGDRSFWDQPSRAYMTTVPATTLLNSVGINDSSNPTIAPQLDHLLKDDGFVHARLGTDWASMTYANPSVLGSGSQTALSEKITDLKNNGIRPLINLYAGDGAPTPSIGFKGTFTVAPKVGNTVVHVNAATAAQIVPGKTGIFNNGVMNGILFTSVDKNDDVTLSKPITSLSDLSGSMRTFAFTPFEAPFLSDGKTPNPAFTATLDGWLEYVKAIGDTVKAAYGSDNFDMEVWNELSFGSNFLSINKYYSTSQDPTGTGNVDAQILKDTAEFIKNPANGLSDVQLTNGFASETPFPSAANQPAGVIAMSKHYYPTHSNYPQDINYNGAKPLNALLQKGYTNNKAPYVDSFVPTYVSHYPEDALSGNDPQTLLRDLSPITTYIYGEPHGSNVLNQGGQKVQIWETEWNLGLSTPKGGGDPQDGSYVFTNADREYIQSKSAIRYLSAYVNKGVTQVDFYAANGNNGPYSFNLVDGNFFNDIAANPNVYPGDAAGGETMQVISNYLKAFSGAQPITQPKSLSLDEVDDYSGNIQFKGNGTAGAPDLYDRDLLGFFPYQVTNNSFMVPIYIQTKDIEKIYNSNDPTEAKFNMPAETYRLTIGGVDGNNVNNISLYDPLTGSNPAVNVISRSANNIVIEIPVTDSPRLLYMSESGGGNQQPYTNPTVNITTPTSNTTVSGTINIQSTATSDPRTNIAVVRYFIDGKLLSGTQNNAPYTNTWNTKDRSNGTYTLTAVVQDGVGNQGTSTPIKITVDNQSSNTSPVPTISITAPNSGQVLPGGLDTLRADALPSENATITSVQYYLDGKTFGPPITSSPYTYKWHTLGFKGSHILKAVVTDSSGQTATSTPISFSVNY